MSFNMDFFHGLNMVDVGTRAKRFLHNKQGICLAVHKVWIYWYMMILTYPNAQNTVFYKIIFRKWSH